MSRHPQLGRRDRIGLMEDEACPIFRRGSEKRMKCEGQSKSLHDASPLLNNQGGRTKAKNAGVAAEIFRSHGGGGFGDLVVMLGHSLLFARHDERLFDAGGFDDDATPKTYLIEAGCC
jgi:hypothetical protein